MKKSWLHLTESERSNPVVGDVFLAKGGPRRRGTRYWLVVTVNDNRVVHMLGITGNGTINSSTSLGVHAMWDRPKLCRIVNVGQYINECIQRARA